MRNLCEAGVSFAYSFQPNRTEYSLHHVIVLADLSCPGADRFLIQVSRNSILDSEAEVLKFISVTAH